MATMQAIFKPKHQKLILQCYPSTKLNVAETKPNQAELSYLVFYASSRRTKLEKVGNFLLKKTSADISHQRVGHLKVTLYILQELIVKCSEDLGFMTPYVVSILYDIVRLGDLPTCQLASDVFITYCEQLQPIQRQVFSSDINLLSKFLNVIKTFLGFAIQPPKNGNPKDWLNISLRTSLVVADYIDPSFSQFEKDDLIRRSIHLLLDTINTHQTDLTLARVNTGNSSTGSAKYTYAQKDTENMKSDELAALALKSFFDTPSKRQLDDATRNVIAYFIEKKKDIRWANSVLIMCTKKTHIELRHRIMIIASYELDKYSKGDNVQTLDYLLKIIANLLGSPSVHFIGLPVLDILNRNIRFEMYMVLNNKTHILKESYSEIIRSLAGRIYYNNQINDMITSILSHYYYVYTNLTENDGNAETAHENEINTSSTEVNSTIGTQSSSALKNIRLNDQQMLGYTQVIADNIREIFLAGERPEVSLKKSEYQLSLFNYLYLILSFGNYSNVAPQMQMIWLKVIDEFYTTCQQEYLCITNVDSCITSNSDNNLCLFLDSISKVLENDTKDEIKAQVSLTCSTLVKTFKLNFLMNYLKVASSWLEDPQHDFKYALSLLLLGLCATTIPDGQTLAAISDSKIAYAQQQNVWPPYIGYQPSSAPSTSVLTIDELMETLHTIPSVAEWLGKVNTNEPLLTFARQPPKPLSTLLLMSASNSVASLPVNSGKSAINVSIPHPQPKLNGHYIDDNTPLDNDTSFASSDAYSMHDLFVAPPMVPHARSLRSGWSMRSDMSGTGRSMRSGSRRVNLRELKEIRGGNVEDYDLSRIVRIRTGGTMNDTVPTGANGSANVVVGSGLAYAISGLDLGSEDH